MKTNGKMGHITKPTLHQNTIDEEEKLAKNIFWPPPGWPMFSNIIKTNGIAYTNLNNTFLKYDITMPHEGVYTIEIIEGHISLKGTTLNPVIGMTFKGKNINIHKGPQDNALAIHIQGQCLLIERNTVLQALLIITCIIGRIDQNQVPNIKRLLKIYKLA
jgi:hypothetical protein